MGAAPRLSFPRRRDDRLMFPKFIARGSGYLRFLVPNAPDAGLAGFNSKQLTVETGISKLWVFLVVGLLITQGACSVLVFPSAHAAPPSHIGRPPAALQAQKPTTTTGQRRRIHDLRKYHDAKLSSTETRGVQEDQ